MGGPSGNGMRRLTTSLNYRGISYRDYLQSDHWRDLKRRFRASRLCKRACYACEARGLPLEIHHKSYNRMWSEKLHDLIELCAECHSAVHFALRTYADLHLWTVARRLRKKGRERFLAWCSEYRSLRSDPNPVSTATRSAGQ